MLSKAMNLYRVLFTNVVVSLFLDATAHGKQENKNSQETRQE